MTVGLVSLGCAKNAVDLQVMVGHLLKAGFTLSADPNQADVLLVNTCAFIEQAREEAVSEILRACELKRQGACRVVIVSGCLSQRYVRELPQLFSDVDAFVGIDALDRIVQIVSAALARQGRTPLGACYVPRAKPHRVFSPPVPALRLTGVAFAYLKIAEGCLHRCSYCAIPAIRGSYRSRSLADILAEARALIATGVRELVVVAQDPMLWGCDFKQGTRGKRQTLVTLLRALDRLEGDFRTRVLYSYPSEITDDYIDWLATSPRAIKYVDVPLQHTVPAILKAMNRTAAVAASLSIVARLRAKVPGITLRTTVMTGFPGETLQDFKQLLADLARMDFDHLGCFAFSPEEGTKAMDLPSEVSSTVAVRRCRQVMAQQAKRWAIRASKMVGQVCPALVVQPGVARMESQAPDVDGIVRIKKSAAQVGEVILVKLVRVDGFDFDGKVVSA